MRYWYIRGSAKYSSFACGTLATVLILELRSWIEIWDWDVLTISTLEIWCVVCLNCKLGSLSGNLMCCVSQMQSREPTHCCYLRWVDNLRLEIWCVVCLNCNLGSLSRCLMCCESQLQSREPTHICHLVGTEMIRPYTGLHQGLGSLALLVLKW